MVLPTPEISVVMPVWNAKLKKLIRANDSVLGQSFRDFEFIIVVDEPDECTSELLTDYVLKDKRVKVFSNPVRQGLVAALNKGIALSHGKYIARMDSDDQCCPGRLQKQYDFMESHPEVGISGTAFRLKDYRGHTWDGRYPVNDTASLCSRLMFSPCFGHPTVIFRSNFIKSIPGPYDPSFIYAEDYELWVRCAGKTEYSNIDEILVFIENDGDDVSCKHLAESIATASRIRTIAAKKFGFWCSPPPEDSPEYPDWLRYVYEKNELGGIFPKKFFRDELGAWWYSYCINRRARDGLPALWSFWSSPLSRHANISIYQKIKLIGACLLKYNPEAKNG